MKEATNYDLLDGGRKLPLVEDFYTIQGEGFHTGKPAYFIRLGGCDVGCRWCDAKYTWNPKLYPPTDISEVVRRATSCQAQAIVITGGEPLLYPLGPLTSALKGQQPPLPEAFWRAHELKVIVEREADLQWAERNAEQVGRECKLFLQPEWSVSEEIMPLLVEYVKAHPAWNISIQTHKYMHIP